MKRVLEPQEVDAMLATFSKAPTSIRNRALVVVLWRTGLRISEALDLTKRDLDRNDLRIVVRNGKGGKDREVWMPSLSWDALDAWLAARKKLGLGRKTPIFCTLKGDGLHPVYVRTMLKRKATRAGIEPARVHPHAFRHAFAVDLAQEGKPLHLIQRLLGHANLAVTTRYLSRIDPRDVRDAAVMRDGEDELSEVALLRREVAALRTRLDAAA